ncbi:CAAX amino terminal protease family [Fervidobacterium pennivorans DSM 9078]|uniref:CAAX amino terminal protease family n=1 Tax=Fervidobacterium pennivorans (strain DSM 9078 / Ven5) TaxID=771875 RepID=H9UB22_FERPD|nr:CPBP family intramembrane glutamic endopeptidase [Fervidobacterium pennivorans]AFG34715.1 CAAX amino terminal protease family [Fervidobacterium pennivorans DSM 9078]
MRKSKQVLLYVLSIAFVVLWMQYSTHITISIEKLINGGEFFQRSIGSPFFKDNMLNFIYGLLEPAVNTFFYFLLSITVVYLSNTKEGLKNYFGEISSLFTKKPIKSLLFGLYVPFLTHVTVILLPGIHIASLFYVKSQVDIIEGWLFWLEILQVFVLAFYEELIIRVFIYKGYSKALNNTFALLFSLSLFTILHENRLGGIGLNGLSDFQLYMIQVPYYFSAGFLYIYLLDSRQSFWTSLGAHFSVNYFFARALNADLEDGIFVIILITISQTIYVLLDYFARYKFGEKISEEVKTL